MRNRVLPILLALVCPAFSAPPFLNQDFEQDSTGWFVFGGEGKIQITHDASLVKTGKGAMEFRYETSGTKPAIAVMPVAQPITEMKSMDFWMMADSQTAAAVTLIEKNGGRYAANFWLEANTWQRVELTPDDFFLATGPGDPKDPDGKLDLDQVETIGILDVSQIFSAMLGASHDHAHIAVAEHSGVHKLWVDDFQIGAASPSDAPRAAFLIEDFREPQSNWVSFGGANMKLDRTGATVKGTAMRVDFDETPGRFPLVTRILPALNLTGATHLAFDIAADKPAHLIFAFQEKSDAPEGPRYNAEVEVSGGGKAEHRDLAISAFEFDDGGPADPNHKLDLDKLKLLSIVDITAAYTNEDSVNTIRIGKIEGVTRK